MRAFQLHQPTTTEEAVEALASLGPDARPLAGGTDLVAGVMRDQIVGKGMPYPRHLVDLSRIPTLRGIATETHGLRIGAATPLMEIAESSDARQHWPLLAEAAESVASPEIRVVGTLGGNIHQRPRCWFFRNKDFDCVKKGGDICFAVKGDNRYNAILGGNLCYIVHPSDLATALLALGAYARVVSRDGERLIPFDDYFVAPQDDLLRESVLRPDEILADVLVPHPAPRVGQAWEKLNEKGGPTWDFALVSVAAVVDAEDGVWRDGRIVLGGVAPVPYRATVIEEALAGEDVRSTVADAARTIRDVARPMSDNAYKLELVEYLVERVVVAAVEAAAGATERARA
jgi:xanthine dehydrogenase YagS FAD-binding subunit